MKNKLFALALAGVTVIGALATGTFVMADGNTGNTTVTLTVPENKPQGDYEISIPADTALNKDGSAVIFGKGISVYGHDMTNSVTVTASSKSNFELKSEKAQSTIRYSLYDKENAAEQTTTWNFTAAEINSEERVTRDVYGKVNTDDVANAQPGNYSDVITFTASVDQSGSDVPVGPSIPAGPTAADILEDGAGYRITFGTENSDISVIGYEYRSGKFVCTEFTVGGKTSDAEGITYLELADDIARTTVSGTKLIFDFTGNINFTLDTSSNKYVWDFITTDFDEKDYPLTNFEVKPAGSNEYTDIFSSLTKVDSLGGNTFEAN